jgi:segregation and condensation protein A
MTEYRVNLDIYNGPLDLLLYLIRRDEVDIYDIPIARITEQYVQFVELIQNIDINLAAEFLVLAATLMEIKSALLLPREEVAEGEEDITDPRLDLVRQLLEYKKFKDAAGELAELSFEQKQRFPRSLVDLDRLREQEKAEQEQELDLEGIQIWDLFDAFRRLMDATLAGKKDHQVYHDDTPIDLYEADILDRAQHQQPLTFEQVFLGRSNKLEIVGLFLALLELIRMKLIRIEQERVFSPIYIIALTDEPADLAVAHAVSQAIDKLPSVAQKEKDEALSDPEEEPPPTQ